MNDLIINMEKLKQNMVSVSNQMHLMECFKGQHNNDHSLELLGASEVLQTWIDGIKKEQSK